MLVLLSLFVSFVLCLSCFLVCSLQPCGHLLGNGWPLLALFSVMFSCVFVIFPCVVLGQVVYLIVLIPDLVVHLYFKCNCCIPFKSYWLETTIFPKSKSKEDHDSTKILRRTSKFELDLHFIMLYPFVNNECIPSKFVDWKQKVWQRRQWLTRI